MAFARPYRLVAYTLLKLARTPASFEFKRAALQDIERLACHERMISTAHEESKMALEST